MSLRAAVNQFKLRNLFLERWPGLFLWANDIKPQTYFHARVSNSSSAATMSSP